MSDEQLDQDARRTLMLVTKVLQPLANLSPIFREDFMQSLTPFLQTHTKQMEQFYESLSMVPPSGPPDARRAPFTEEDKIKSLALIVGQLTKHLDRLEVGIVADPRTKDPSAFEENKIRFATLKKILMTQFGQIPISPRLSEHARPRGHTKA